MLEIVVTLCFFAGNINDAAYQVRDCTRVHMQFVDEGGAYRPIMPRDCALNGQAATIEWQKSHHDGRIVTGVQCGRVNPQAHRKA